MACPLGYGDTKSMYVDGADPYDDPDGTVDPATIRNRKLKNGNAAAAAPPPLIEAFLNKPKSAPKAPAPVPAYGVSGLCGMWYIRLASAVVVFFVLAACAHSLLRMYQPDSEFLVLSPVRLPIEVGSGAVWPPLAASLWKAARSPAPPAPAPVAAAANAGLEAGHPLKPKGVAIKQAVTVVPPTVQAWTFDVVTGSAALHLVVTVSAGCSTAAAAVGGASNALTGTLDVQTRHTNAYSTQSAETYILRDIRLLQSSGVNGFGGLTATPESVSDSDAAAAASASRFSMTRIETEGANAAPNYRLEANLPTLSFSALIRPTSGIPLVEYFNTSSNAAASFIRRQLFDVSYAPFVTAAACHLRVEPRANGVDSGAAAAPYDPSCTAFASSSTPSRAAPACAGSQSRAGVLVVVPTPTTRHSQFVRAAFSNSTHQIALSYGSMWHRNSGLLFGRTVTRYFQLTFRVPQTTAVLPAAAAGLQTVTLTAVQTNILSDSPQEMSLYADARSTETTSIVTTAAGADAAEEHVIARRDVSDSDAVRGWSTKFDTGANRKALTGSTLIRYESRYYQFELQCTIPRGSSGGVESGRTRTRWAGDRTQLDALIPDGGHSLPTSGCVISIAALNCTAMDASRRTQLETITIDSSPEQIERVNSLAALQRAAATTQLVDSLRFEPERVVVTTRS